MKRLILILAFLATTLAVGAQQFHPTEVTVSSEKINISGNYFYVHKVLQGQTLYSVSKAYGVSIEEINKNNPSVSSGLKAGTTIYIPIKNQPNTKKIVSTTAANTSELQKEREAQQKENAQKYKKYSVKWYETLSDVAKKFNVSVGAICALNNIEQGSTLQKRQVLLIPDKDFKIIKDEVIVVAPPMTEITPVEETKKIDFNTHRTYTISLVLPFGAASSTDNTSVNQIDFYSGVLLAMDDLKTQKGLGFYKLNVIDLSEYSSIEEMISSGRLNDSELIVGPITSKDLAPVSEFAKKHKIPVVSPMDPKAENLINNNPFFFQFPVSSSYAQGKLIDKMKDAPQSDSTDFTLIYESGSAQSSIVTSVIEDMQKRGISFDTLSYGILQGREIDSVMMQKLDSLHSNRVFVASESEAFVNDVLRNLHLLMTRDTFKISVYGEPKWKNFEIIELEYFHLLGVHLSLPYYIDYNNAQTKSFVSKYWEIFKAEPSPYSFQGYDVISFFISALTEFGREFPIYLPKYQMDLLQSSILMTSKEPDSGYENICTRNIVYTDNWSIKKW